MSDNKPCEVENCSGTYVTHVLSYCNLSKVKTSHISLVNDAWAQGYEIFIFNGTQEINIRDCTVKELRPIHNIQRLLQANAFETSGVEF